MNPRRTVIVGAGMMGPYMAFHRQDRGVKETVVDRTGVQAPLALR